MVATPPGSVFKSKLPVLFVTLYRIISRYYKCTSVSLHCCLYYRHDAFLKLLVGNGFSNLKVVSIQQSTCTEVLSPATLIKIAQLENRNLSRKTWVFAVTYPVKSNEGRYNNFQLPSLLCVVTYTRLAVKIVHSITLLSVEINMIEEITKDRNPFIEIVLIQVVAMLTISYPL